MVPVIPSFGGGCPPPSTIRQWGFNSNQIGNRCFFHKETFSAFYAFRHFLGLVNRCLTFFSQK
jgi:hypothetical protein